MPRRFPDNRWGHWWVVLRPHTQEFLAAASKSYDLALWTASSRELAAAKVDGLDSAGLLKHLAPT